jgi:hypothetical protein
MALIVDPDLLADSATDNNSTEVYIHPSNRTIKLVLTGDLSSDGVTLKCLYSFLKEEWKDDPHGKGLAALPFPMVPITDEAFEFVDGWDLLNDTARYLIRTGGWTVRNTSGNTTQMWAGIIGLGSIEADDQLYFQQVSAGAATNVQLTGQVNQAVQIYRDDDGDGNLGEGSDFDRRTFFKLFVRERAQIFDDANLADIGVTTLAAQAYRFPITTASDALKVTTVDGTISSSSPWNQIKIRYFSGAYSRDVDTTNTPRDFGIVIDVGTHSGIDGQTSAGGSTLTSAAGGITGADYTGGTVTVHEGANKGVYTISGTPTGTVVTISGTFASALSNQSFTLQRAAPVVATAEQIYEKVQYDLRQNADIDATGGTVTGKTADLLLNFVGDTLQCGFFAPSNPNGGGSGVVIEGFAAADTNRITFKDNGFTSRTYPFVAALTLQFGTNLQSDVAAKYWVYFTRSHRVTGTDLAITGASGETATLSSSVTNLTQIANGEQFLVSGFANSANNGLYEATGAGGATSVTVKKARAGHGNFTNEAAGPTVNLDMNPYDSTSAIIVNDNSGSPMTGTVGAAASVQKTFNYDGNIQGGRAAGVDALITAVAIGLSTAQPVRATGTIGRSTSNAVALVAPLERNYANP